MADLKPRVLDLFCKAGGAATGLYRAGFDVTGVDIVLQRRYPFSFIHADAIGEDVRRRLSSFDFIWASPPCQGYTALRHAPGALGTAPKLIGIVRDILAASGKPYCIENVQEAASEMRSPVTLCGSMFGLGAEGHQLQRHRLFETNFGLTAPPCSHSDAPVIGVYGGHARRRSAGHGGRGTKDVWVGGHLGAASKALGIDWMNLAELSEAIPPAYSEHIGKQAILAITRLAA